MVLRYLSRLQCKVYGSKERARSGENDEKNTDFEDEDDHYIDYGDDNDDDDGDDDNDDEDDDEKTVFTSMGIIKTVSPIIFFCFIMFHYFKDKNEPDFNNRRKKFAHFTL